MRMRDVGQGTRQLTSVRSAIAADVIGSVSWAEIGRRLLSFGGVREGSGIAGRASACWPTWGGRSDETGGESSSRCPVS